VLLFLRLSRSPLRQAGVFFVLALRELNRERAALAALLGVWCS
jgi:hypothetical protein